MNRFNQLNAFYKNATINIRYNLLGACNDNFSSPRFNLLREARHCFWWSSVSDDLLFSCCTFLRKVSGNAKLL